MSTLNDSARRGALRELHWLYDPQLDGRHWIRPDGIRVTDAEAFAQLDAALKARGDEGVHDG